NIRTIYTEQSKPDEYADFMRSTGHPLSVTTEDSLTFNAADKLYDDQKMNEALAGYNNYLQRFPNGSFALDAKFNRAEIYNAKKDWPNALSAYEEVAADAPNKYAERSVVMAARIAFFELKDYARAERLYM